MESKKAVKEEVRVLTGQVRSRTEFNGKFYHFEFKVGGEGEDLPNLINVYSKHKKRDVYVSCSATVTGRLMTDSNVICGILAEKILVFPQKEKKRHRGMEL